VISEFRACSAWNLFSNQHVVGGNQLLKCNRCAIDLYVHCFQESYSNIASDDNLSKMQLPYILKFPDLKKKANFHVISSRNTF
jgi:hypothetical protein